MGRIGSVKSDIETGLLAYTVSYYSVEENRSTTWIRICNPYGEPTPDPSLKGGEKEPLLVDEFVGYEPAWFGNSGCLAYLKGGKLYLRRDKEEVEVAGAEDIEGFLLSPMRDKIILIKQVKTVQTTADQYPDLPLATGHMHEDLMYKHWDEWTETAPQPFVCELQIEYYGEGERIKSAKIGESVNILEGTAFESPMKPFGGIEQLAWNPNNEEIAYTCRKKTGLEYAVSTNSDIYLYDLHTRAHKNITADNKGYDTNPSYSPDGKWIAWLSMERDGYESDENRLMVMSFETGEKRFLSRAMDTNVDEYQWLDDTSLVFTACKQATVQLYRVTLDGWTSKLTDGQWDLGLGDTPSTAAGRMVYDALHASYSYELAGEPEVKMLDAVQKVRFRYLALPSIEDDVAAETRRQIEAIVEQSNPNEVYDADRHYLPEVTERAYLAALDAVLAHAEKYYTEDELTLSLTYTDGRWQMLMSPELLRALGGGTGA